jgi:hemolysin activation/secretion protein
MKKSHYLTGAVLGSLSMTVLSAVPFTDTGSIYNQIKQNQIDKAEQNVHPMKKKKIIQEKTLSAKQTVLVRGFKIIGNDEFSKAEMNKVLAPFIGRKMYTGELSEAANALTEYYHKKGFFDTDVALISPYILIGGIIVLVVDEKHLEKDGISVVNSGKRIKTEKVQNLWDNIMKPGAMKQDDFERAMLLTNDLPGISAKADLYYGTNENTDDLVITVTDEKVFNGNIDIDNFGSYYTGRVELGTTLYWNSPTKNGEEIVARFITTGKYSNFGYLDLAVPVFDNGMRIGASVDFLKYELDTSKAIAEGDGDVWDIRAYVKYPVVRTEDFTVETELNYTHRVLKDNNATTEIDYSIIDKGMLTISGNRSDEFLENGITYFSMALTAGDLKLDNQEYARIDALTSDTAGNYTKLNFSFSRLQNLVAALSSIISVDGQWASKNLDTSEKYFLGGPYGVAGYPVGEVAGDNAVVFNADLRYDLYNMPWKGDFQLKAFYSYGWVQLLKDPDAYITYYGLDKDNNEMTLQTVGVGFSQTWSNSVVLRAVVGKQVGENEYRAINVNHGKDYDQSDSDYRGWVDLIYYF